MSCGLPAGLYAVLAEQLPWLVRAMPAAPRLPLLSSAPVAVSHKTRVLVSLAPDHVARLHAAADRYYYGRVNDALRAVLAAALEQRHVHTARAAAAPAPHNHAADRGGGAPKPAAGTTNDRPLHADAKREQPSARAPDADDGPARSTDFGRSDAYYNYYHVTSAAASAIGGGSGYATAVVSEGGAGFHRRTYSDAFSFVSDDGTDGEEGAEAHEQRSAAVPPHARPPVPLAIGCLTPPYLPLYPSHHVQQQHQFADAPSPSAADFVALPVSISGVHITWLKNQAKDAGCDLSTVLRAVFQELEREHVPVFPGGNTLSSLA